MSISCYLRRHVGGWMGIVRWVKVGTPSTELANTRNLDLMFLWYRSPPLANFKILQFRCHVFWIFVDFFHWTAKFWNCKFLIWKWILNFIQLTWQILKCPSHIFSILISCSWCSLFYYCYVLRKIPGAPWPKFPCFWCSYCVGSAQLFQFLLFSTALTKCLKPEQKYKVSTLPSPTLSMQLHFHLDDL